MARAQFKKVYRNNACLALLPICFLMTFNNAEVPMMHYKERNDKDGGREIYSRSNKRTLL